ncbi:MAG: M6 family metalloprotease domain-containing protein [Muribaculaceae bacterium]|nr:M6 family metalloprotease domain-containing protein [Muribaculaceae bacterium]
MKILRTTLTGIALCAIATGVEAKLARPGFFTVTQPDGSSIEIQKIGDECLHFVTDKDGNLLSEDETGFYTYAVVNQAGIIESTGVKASAIANPQVTKVNIQDIDINALSQKRNVAERRLRTFKPFESTPSAVAGMSRAPQTGKGLASSTFPVKGSPKALVILVEFSDISFTLSDPKQYFTDLMTKPGFSEYGGTGSSLDYFTDQSHGQFTPQFDVYGPVKLSHPESYYGQNDIYGNDKQPWLMVGQAVQALDSEVDFSQYDTDKDGLIDNVYIFYAGVGEASYGAPSTTIWPHSYDVRYAYLNVMVDGVKLAHYACSNEWESNRPDGIGTFVHEFSHVMGFPDLYATDYNHQNTPGDYDVLDSGNYNNNSCTPPSYGAYELNAMGWNEPIMLSGDMTVSLDEISTGQFGLVATASDDEFFLFENRQQKGWDKFIPGHGMLIWHIDYQENLFESNEPNDNRNHMCIAIEKANGREANTSRANTAGWPFPGTSAKTSFTAQTSPAMVTWGGVAIDEPITNIREENGIITFDVGAGARIFPPVVFVDLPGSGDRFFHAHWDAVEDATDYLVTVYVDEGNVQGTVTNSFDNSQIGDGWTTEGATFTFYTTSSNSGLGLPSIKFSSLGQTLVSPRFESVVSSIKFWAKGLTTTDETVISVEGNVNDQWVNILNYVPKNREEETVSITNIPADVYQIRFVYSSVKGNVAVDDISITYGGGIVTLPDYNSVSTGGANNITVDKLESGKTDYIISVRSTDGVYTSQPSNPVNVSVGAMAGVDNISIDATGNEETQYFNMLGMPVVQPVPGTLVIERRGNVARKIIVKE